MKKYANLKKYIDIIHIIQKAFLTRKAAVIVFGKVQFDIEEQLQLIQKVET